MLLGGGRNPRGLTIERTARNDELGRIDVDGSERSRRRFFGTSSHFEIDLPGRLRSVCENGHHVVRDFGVAPENREHVPLTTRLVDESTRSQRRQKRDVVGKNAELARGTGRHDFLDLLIEEQSLGCDDSKSKARRCHLVFAVQAARRLAFSMTSSIVPCM